LNREGKEGRGKGKPDQYRPTILFAPREKGEGKGEKEKKKKKKEKIKSAADHSKITLIYISD